MEDEIRKLRQALAEQQRQLDEVQRIREEQQRRLEEVENTTKPLSFYNYVEACHSLNLAINVITEKHLTTQGITTNPVGRVYPRRIVPWVDFPERQEAIWALLADASFDNRGFPSQHQIDYVLSVLSIISCEQDLRHYERDTVEIPVMKLVRATYDNLVLRERLNLRGTVTFESHTNLGSYSDNLTESVGQMSLTEAAGAGQAANATAATGRIPRRVRAGNGIADQFCIRRTENDRDIPVLSIEYKAPHKLSPEEVSTGLVGEIQPARDVINQSGEGFTFAAKSLTAAVVTQLFSYMVAKGIQYGYVCTGQAFVFLHIPDDPTMVLYHVCLPNEDVIEDDMNRLHRTAVSQVFAFVLQSLRVNPPPAAWHDAAADLDTWVVEYEDILRKIPQSVRKEKENHTPYKAQRWKGFVRSPIRTRNSRTCKPISASQHRDDSDNDDGSDHDDHKFPPSPTPVRLTRSKKASSSDNTGQGQQSSGGQQKGKNKQASIQERPYCTQACLYGLAWGGPVDARCPNAAEHGPKHIEQAQFLHLLRDQLARDRGPDADSMPLYIRGSVGALFKVRLSAFGYTLVAKGVVKGNLTFLQGEKKVYDELAAIQGEYIPVCVGLIDLILPQYCDGGVYTHILLLSWAGRPLNRCFGEVDKAVAISEITAAYKRLHQFRVLHNDAYPRNILFDAAGGRLMVTDFERSIICRRSALGPLSPNSQRKRKRILDPKHEKDEFTKEVESAICLAGDLFASNNRTSVAVRG